MKWITYQRERFPLVQHVPLIAAFSSSAIAYSAMLCGHDSPTLPAFAVAFFTCLIFFLQLRIADEFKDIDEDRRYRPYRPVPRGLITLRELGWVFALGAGIQLTLALIFYPPLLIILVIGWAYLALMSVEFFAREWLTARPITYLWTHMLIMPIVDFYATACHWMPRGEKPVLGLVYFLAASFFNGLVIEIGRKLRHPDDEEMGVPTYSKLWGARIAPIVWFCSMLSTAAFALAAAHLIGHAGLLIASMSAILLWSLIFMRKFIKGHTPGKTFELISGIWTLVLYLGLGLVPLIFN